MDPHSLLDTKFVEEALKADKGSDVKLCSWRFEDFLKEGDNLASFVTCIKVTYLKDGNEHTESYIVKLNPTRSNKDWDGFMNTLFEHEIVYLSKVKPLIESVLPSHCNSVGVPTHYASNCSRGKEVIICNDFRKLGYTMNNRMKGLDMPHLTVAFKELAKAHAGGYVLLNKRPEIAQELQVLENDVLVIEDNKKKPGEDMIDQLFGSQMLLTANFISMYPQFKDVVPWIRDLRKTFMKDMSDAIQYFSPKFRVISHGDLWNNNMLFKYDNNIPVSVKFVDLQLCRISSPAIDILQIFYTSVSGDLRTKNLSRCLQIYFEEFKDIVESASFAMPFTLDELQTEYQDKIIHGIIFGLSWGISTLFEESQFSDFKNLKTDDMEEYIQGTARTNVSNLKNPVVEDRLIHIVNDIKTHMKRHQN